MRGDVGVPTLIERHCLGPLCGCRGLCSLSRVERVNAVEQQLAGLCGFLSRVSKAAILHGTEPHPAFATGESEAEYPALAWACCALCDLEIKAAAVAIHARLGVLDRSRRKPMDAPRHVPYPRLGRGYRNSHAPCPRSCPHLNCIH